MCIVRDRTGQGGLEPIEIRASANALEYRPRLFGGRPPQLFLAAEHHDTVQIRESEVEVTAERSKPVQSLAESGHRGITIGLERGDPCPRGDAGRH